MALSWQNINTSQTTSVTIGTHAVGDLIFIAAANLGTFTATSPSAPAASGTVPAWVDDLNNAGDTNAGALRVAHFVANATNHTSGTWTTANVMAAIVIRGQAVSPIGGNAEALDSAGTSSHVPSITLTDSSGASFIIQFFCSGGFNTGPTPDTGYTNRGNSTAGGGGGIAVTTKDTTTSDGTAACVMSSGSSFNRGGQIEVLALAGLVNKLVSVRQAINRAGTY